MNREILSVEVYGPGRRGKRRGWAVAALLVAACSGDGCAFETNVGALEDPFCSDPGAICEPEICCGDDDVCWRPESLPDEPRVCALTCEVGADCSSGCCFFHPSENRYLCGLTEWCAAVPQNSAGGAP